MSGSERLLGLAVRSLVPLALVALLFLPVLSAAEGASPRIVALRLDGVVDPFTASYVEKGIAAANRDEAEAVLITIDTPGGLDSSMRTIVKAILGSRVPVVCYTGPAGARAASAGAFIMLACPLSAMAPGTNIGAAHPVGVSGAIEQQKVTNDAAAYIRSLALRWDRNADWAERAVRESVSISAQEARRIDVVDFLAPSEHALLTRIDGREIRLAGGEEATLDVAGASVEPRRMGIGARLLHGLVDPNLAFLFFYLGLALVVVELLHPGLSVPGILGTLLLVTAVMSFGLLPIQLGGVVLLAASVIFFLLELKHPGIGLPTAGGVACLVLGGLLLFDPSVPNARVSPWLLVTVAVAAGLFFAFVVRAALKARHEPVSGGIEAVVGKEGVVLDDLDPRGLVRVLRETWSAESSGPRIPRGTPVRVVRVAGLRLIVEPVPGASPDRELARHPGAWPEGGNR